MASSPPPASLRLRSPEEMGRAIRARRRALRLSQADLAAQTGLSEPTIGAIERGKPTAQVGLVLLLCRDLGLRCPPSDDSRPAGRLGSGGCGSSGGEVGRLARGAAGAGRWGSGARSGRARPGSPRRGPRWMSAGVRLFGLS